MSKKALIVVDVQNDYFPDYEGAKFPLVNIEAAAARMGQLLAKYRAEGLPVIHVRHEFDRPDAPFFLPGSDGAQIHASVAPLAGEPVVVKHKVNSFLGTNLQELLDEAEITELLVIGAMTQHCVGALVRAAADKGYPVSVAHDACATRDLPFDGQIIPAAMVHGATMASLASSYANVTTTEALLETAVAA